MILGLPEGTETSYCMGCRKEIYLGKYILRGSYEPDYDPADDPVIWRHANGYHRSISDSHSAEPGFPEIITFCGSTKFRPRFESEMRRLTMEGNIVISVGLFGHQEVEECKWCNLGRDHVFHSDDGSDRREAASLGWHEFESKFDFGTDEEPSELRTMLDRLHFRKIDLCHRVHVINPRGYIGTSTAREIYYAARAGKSLSYLSPVTPAELAGVMTRGEEAMYPLLTEAQ